MAKMNPYGGSDWGGLFASQGNTLNDVRAKIGQEREAKVRQAYADAIQGGGSLNAARIARAAEQQKQMMMGVAQNLFGSEDGIISQDPRLARAAKRDKDRQEITSILGTYTDPNSVDGSRISEAEMNQGFSELMKRGYVSEAKEFLAMAQSMGSERRADVSSGLEQDKFKLDKLIATEDIDIKRGNLAINEFNAKHRQKIDWATLDVKKDDLKTKRDISYAQLAWDKNKSRRSQDEIERSNRAREALRKTGHDIDREGNVIKWKQVNDADRINTEKLAQTDRDFKLRSRIADFERSFKTKSFEWEKEMGRINNDLKKQGLEIRREGNRIQLVGIETTAETADKRIKANLAIAEKRIISAEEIAKLGRESREGIAKARDKTSLEIANIKSKPTQKEIKTVKDDDRAQILSHIKGTPGLEDKMKLAFGETAWYKPSFVGLKSDSVAILTSKAKTIKRHYDNAGQTISLNQALDLLVSGMGSGEKEDKPKASTTSKPVPQVTIEELKE
tara:strand:+ start:2691 stop:4205 length:1515 start_codon:yes stop_codon:yes gene_type:complete